MILIYVLQLVSHSNRYVAWITEWPRFGTIVGHNENRGLTDSDALQHLVRFVVTGGVKQ